MFRLRPPGVAKREYDIKAIPTYYKGTRFKSRLEARWAVFFEHAAIRWEYEPQVIRIGAQLHYLPDFFLYSNKYEMFAEVKPDKFTATEKFKCQALATSTEIPCLGLEDAPDMQKEYLLFQPEKHRLEKHPALHCFFIVSNLYPETTRRKPLFEPERNRALQKAQQQFIDAQYRAHTQRF